MTGTLRPYAPTDRDAIAEVCLRTGDAGGDARGLYRASTLLADVYALPYVDLEPATAFVVVLPDDAAPDDAARAGQDAVLRVADGVLVGYVLGAPDTVAFVERWSREWTPGYLERHPAPALPPASGGPGYTEAQLWHDGAHPERMLSPGPDVLADYPAHLHIDLLPQAQGQGWGRRLIGTLCEALAARGVPGVHLSYAASNTNARAFYDRLGFVELPGSSPDAPLMGLATQG
ncbi:GCN5-related N-acetyltransferase [Xylanimonas cellulosilytica DSM 15894]|uniref:GCN5-related N-acetyltransferase n=1 Tax=Xylanimonas cellulosilytica (strain DSM 15894 / JCM 12276 / CECT 5975 / KCTC 9989 / LMG 20990 / NBRC 107835 / XIL07) TaxID=446471 RepID=D1BSW8_XYLCX|nr:GNAT family N-acetyltransferase [Xylanimonas cellulosilytica]ACZ30810.1 GCN5-related N-acetyltransferase [Xylanimonas cellulosilytica DSM 15894]